MVQACTYLCHICLYDIGGFGEFGQVFYDFNVDLTGTGDLPICI